MDCAVGWKVVSMGEVEMMESAGRWMLIVGGILILMGAIFILAQKVPFLGNLPGDIRYESNGTTVYIPLSTCLLLSVLLSVLLNVLLRVLGK